MSNILENRQLEAPERIEVKTEITEDGNIDQRVIAKFPSGGQLSMMQSILKLQEDGIRDALIKLGWTPPAGKGDLPGTHIIEGFVIKMGKEFTPEEREALAEYLRWIRRQQALRPDAVINKDQIA